MDVKVRRKGRRRISSASDVCLQFLGKKISVAQNFIQFPKYFPHPYAFTKHLSHSKNPALLLHFIYEIFYTQKRSIHSLHILTSSFRFLSSSHFVWVCFFVILLMLHSTLHFNSTREIWNKIRNSSDIWLIWFKPSSFIVVPFEYLILIFSISALIAVFFSPAILNIKCVFPPEDDQATTLIRIWQHETKFCTWDSFIA